MSKRFGRNQKRKMRAKIEDLEANNRFTNKLLKRNSDQKEIYLSQLKELIHNIRLWWDNSVLLDPKVVEISSKLPPIFRMAIHTRMTKNWRDTQIDRVVYETLYAIKVVSGTDIGTRNMHIMLRTNGDIQDVGYYIDTQAFDTFQGMPGSMEKYVFESIRHEFNKQFSGRLNRHEKQARI